MHRLLVLLCVLGQCKAVIERLNLSDYYRMPPLYQLDDYDRCLADPQGMYCIVDLNLVSETPSPLLDMIREYSDYKIKHFNHTQLHRGVCIQKTCRDYLTRNETEEIIEACFNETIYKDYELKVQVAKVQYCDTSDMESVIDGLDITMAVVYLLLVAMNVIGTFYDCRFYEAGAKDGNPYLMAFSIRRNWRKLTAPSGVGPDPRLARLKAFNGMRTLTMCCVFFSHTGLMMTINYLNNPIYVETSYDISTMQILYNGSLVTYTFFVMSSFLLAFNFLIHAEKHGITWGQLPYGILMRWLRLTPIYALILGTVCSWMRHMGSGPLWQSMVWQEADACRQYWWAHLLYINNYIYDDSQCFPQSWYLAADTQLFCIGLLICVAARTTAARKVALSILFVLSLVFPAAHTYFQNLEAVVIQSPETYRNIYATDDTFRLLYVRGHTNLSTYTLGLTAGFLVYHWLTEGKDMTPYKKYRWIVWLTFPAGVATILSGGFFYIDGYEAPTIAKVAYATFYKPIFQLIVLVLAVSCVFKLENVYRGIVEWRGFTWTGRVTYSAFLLHTLIERGLVGSQRLMSHIADYSLMHMLCSTAFLSFLGAAALWITVESPISQISRHILTPKKRHLEDNLAANQNIEKVIVDGQTKL